MGDQSHNHPDLSTAGEPYFWAWWWSWQFSQPKWQNRRESLGYFRKPFSDRTIHRTKCIAGFVSPMALFLRWIQFESTKLWGHDDTLQLVLNVMVQARMPCAGQWALFTVVRFPRLGKKQSDCAAFAAGMPCSEKGPWPKQSDTVSLRTHTHTKGHCRSSILSMIYIHITCQIS